MPSQTIVSLTILKVNWDKRRQDYLENFIPIIAECIRLSRHDVISVSELKGQLELVDHETEIVPRIQAIAAPGHTPGHMALAISSGGDQLLCISDAALHPIHLEQPEWYAAVDFAPEQVVATRRRLLNRAAAEKTLVLAFHFPFPGLGHVVQKGDGWQWQPI